MIRAKTVQFYKLAVHSMDISIQILSWWIYTPCYRSSSCLTLDRAWKAWESLHPSPCLATWKDHTKRKTTWLNDIATCHGFPDIATCHSFQTSLLVTAFQTSLLVTVSRHRYLSPLLVTVSQTKVWTSPTTYVVVREPKRSSTNKWYYGWSFDLRCR